MPKSCDFCINYTYDEEYDCYTCIIDMDEDELYSTVFGRVKDCPYFRMGDEYTIVRKQN